MQRKSYYPQAPTNHDDDQGAGNGLFTIGLCPVRLAIFLILCGGGIDTGSLLQFCSTSQRAQ